MPEFGGGDHVIHHLFLIQSQHAGAVHGRRLNASRGNRDLAESGGRSHLALPRILAAKCQSGLVRLPDPELPICIRPLEQASQNRRQGIKGAAGLKE